MQLNELVNLHFDDLNESDLYIWNYINNHREVCTKITIEDLGKKCNVSRTTILRFSKKIGLEGFAELKYYLRNEQTLADVGLGKTVNIYALFENHAKMIRELQNRDYNTCCRMIDHAKRIFVVSSGTIQRSVAKELSRQFLKLGIIMTLVNGDSEINMLARAITADDLLIIISLTGESESAIRIAKVAKTVGSKTISITRINANSLSLLADEPIYIFFGDFPIVFETAYTSPTMFFALTELLFANYHNYQQKKLFQQGNQNYAE